MTENAKNEQGRPITYIGRRIQKGKLQHCFLEDGAVVWWPKAKGSTFAGARIGTKYLIGDHFPALWSEIATGETDEQRRLEWQARDRADFQIKNERAGSASPDLDHAIEAISSARARMPKSQAAAFDAWLLNKIR